jgi:hypothetical protein
LDQSVRESSTKTNARPGSMQFRGLVLACALLISDPYPQAHVQKPVRQVTVPMSVEGDVPIVTLTFRKPDGGLRTARFIFDSGGGAIIFDQSLAADIGLNPSGAVVSEEGHLYGAVNVPTAFLGEMPVDLRTSKAFVHLGVSSFDDRDSVEGLLPGKALQRYQVVLDYPRQQLSVGEPGTLAHSGERFPCPYIASSGHPRIEAAINGVTYGFLLDTGTKLTLVRDSLMAKWSAEHPDWPRSIGAVGPANVPGAADDALLLRVAAIRLGPFTAERPVIVSRSNETYSATSYETSAAIVGALGGNVLSQFRVEIDYPEQLLFLDPVPAGTERSEFDTVGLVLDINPHGQLVVKRVSSSAAAVTRNSIFPGDIILQISGVATVPRTLTQASQALSGTVAERKQLRVLRDGQRRTVTVVVSRIL